MNSRRAFLGQVASGIGGLAIPHVVLGANDRVRFGIIGFGARGQEIARDALSCVNTEFTAISDIYGGHREKAKAIAPSIKTFVDYRLMLEEKDLDAVLISTPPHLHAEHFVASLEAGKHVYQEKIMAFSLNHAKRMRTAYEATKGRQVVQIGHQACSSGHVADAQSWISAGKLGQITAINTSMYRNTPHGKPQWSRYIKPDMTPENIAWNQFLGEAPQVPFDANRFQNWRLFWDYSGGNVHENMCQQAAFWYKVLGLKIPQAVTMTGGLFRWKDGREVPDTMNVSMVQSEQILFSWSSGFGNASPGMAEQVLGSDGTIVRALQIKYLPEKVNRADLEPIIGQAQTKRSAHMQNFIEAIRESKEVNCSFDLGFRVSIACAMAVESFRRGSTVRWDRINQEFIQTVVEADTASITALVD